MAYIRHIKYVCCCCLRIKTQPEKIAERCKKLGGM